MAGWMTYKGLELPDSPVGESGDVLANDLKLLSDGMGSNGLPMSADSYVIAPRGADDIESADNLRAAYAAAKLLTPGGNALSATNRATCFVLPGRYDLGTGDGSNHGLVLDAQYVDLIGFSGVREDTIITSQIATVSRGTIEQTANDVTIANMTLEITGSGSVGSGNTIPSAYFPNSNLAAAKLNNVLFRDPNNGERFGMRIKVEYSGTFGNCSAGNTSFGTGGVASGTFTNCIGGIDSFGGSYSGGGNGTASGTFTNCVGGSGSFGAYGGTASGVFTDCKGGTYSFGASGNASGTYIRCTGGDFSFGGGNTVPSATGIFYACQLLGNGWDGIFTGRMEGCRWEVTGTNKTALKVGTGARIYDTVLIGTGTGKSIDAGSAVNAVIAQCRLNKGIGVNVTNLIGTPYNVDDSNIN